MRARPLIPAAIAAVAPLIAPIPASPASAAPASSASCYKQIAGHWECITPGAFCPAVAHGNYGYAQVTHKKWLCPVIGGGVE